MKIRLEEYSRGARVRLAVDDAPMTAVRGLVEAFTQALDRVKDEQDKEPKVESPKLEKPLNGAWVKIDPGFVVPLVETVPEGHSQPEPEPNTEQPAKRRGRPPKSEAKKAEPAEPVAAEEEPPLPLDLSTASEPEASPEPTPTPSELGILPALAEPPSDDLPDTEVTDSELQRYCGKLAQHFGAAQAVFDLAADFVPEGAVARPTNIRDNSQRWAFIRAAEEKSGVKYHG